MRNLAPKKEVAANGDATCPAATFELDASEEAESSWSSRGFSNFYYQRISVANLKGLGHFFLVAEALLRSAGNVPFGS